jgi:hypothetical protein
VLQHQLGAFEAVVLQDDHAARTEAVEAIAADVGVIDDASLRRSSAG